MRPSFDWARAVLSVLVLFSAPLWATESYEQIDKVLPLAMGDTAPNDQFGASVAIDGDWMVATSPGDDDIGNRPFLSSFNQNNSGSAFVFQRNATDPDTWDLVAKLLPLDASEVFGAAAAISGDVAAVGASNDAGSGSVYVFARNQGGADSWGLVKVVAPDTPVSGARFGDAVALQGDRLVVGAWDDDTANTNAGAAYVFERNAGGNDNWGQITQLIPSGDEAAQLARNFGDSVALDSDFIVVGAGGDNTQASGAGALFVFEKDEGGANQWGEVAMLTAEADAQTSAGLGTAVAIAGSLIVGGAFQRDEAFIFEQNSTTLDWESAGRVESDFPGGESRFGEAVATDGDMVLIGDGLSPPDRNGTIYVYERGESAGQWDLVENLFATDPNRGMNFGSSIAYSNSLLLSGAPEDEDFGRASGSSFVFESNGATFDLASEVNPGESGAEAFFGQAVAVSGNHLLVGAPEDRPAGIESGGVTVFQRTIDADAPWSPVTVLMPAGLDPFDEFGLDLGLSGGTAIVAYRTNGSDRGAYIFDRNQGGSENWGQTQFIDIEGSSSELAVAIYGDTAVIGNWNMNSAYVYNRDMGGPDSWGLVTTLEASDSTGFDLFGWDVAIHQDWIVVGARAHALPASRAGAAYLYRRNEGGDDNWGEVQKLSGSDAQASQEFGEAVAVTSGIVVVGAESTSSSQGAVYVFEPNSEQTWTETGRLTIDDPSPFDFLGGTVSVSHGQVLASAGGWDDPDQTPFDNGTGGVFAFAKDNTGQWVHAGTLKTTDSAQEDGLGHVINSGFTISPTAAIDCNIVVAGAPTKDTINTDVGAAYSFRSDAIMCSAFEH